ncbi:MAG: Uma2 family endonuclease [Roseofilum sp. SBFL]|uniref:Uma2 family endonuclease n=1 Tax=unclassified Roseofilum TaxID=2620099 RepID=UPI001B054E8D|nr:MULTISPECIES: Uma2 family endonuclease [unclassified Roseofilum]MBP0014004.1 Uma2 family endonuclease [Roseofilum sp. SID3]MBP0024371.1 Uma2 family endonuclease [Roseofilum sp. SID2]MBP0037813.1 Uma2 family endonuclease [Roseofilum sp. SID1]MBP0044913.1 Uma2 family endonuclease [Roseofilum sp. SBFL]
METPIISLPPQLALKINLTDEQFWQLCHENDNLQFEKTAQGELIVMPPTGGNTSERNADLTFQLQAWNRQTKLGKVFDSSGCFQLPNGANRAPNSSWVKLERWDALTEKEQDRFVPLCPDFVVELMSPSDTLSQTQAKMIEYINNGAQLGWLINRKQRRVEVYRPQQEVEILDNPQTISGEFILPGFILDLSTIW